MDSSLNELGNFRFRPNGSKGPLLIMGNGHVKKRVNIKIANKIFQNTRYKHKK